MVVCALVVVSIVSRVDLAGRHPKVGGDWLAECVMAHLSQTQRPRVLARLVPSPTRRGSRVSGRSRRLGAWTDGTLRILRQSRSRYADRLRPWSQSTRATPPDLRSV